MDTTTPDLSAMPDQATAHDQDPAEPNDFDLDDHLGRLERLDPADAPAPAEAVTEHLMRRLNATSASHDSSPA